MNHLYLLKATCSAQLASKIDQGFMTKCAVIDVFRPPCLLNCLKGMLL